MLTEDVNLGLIRYVLHEEKTDEITDHFQFLVKDSEPSVVSNSVFHIQWSLISFKYTRYNCYCVCSFLRKESGKLKKQEGSTSSHLMILVVITIIKIIIIPNISWILYVPGTRCTRYLTYAILFNICNYELNIIVAPATIKQ